MKVRIKREQLVKYFDITLKYKWGIVGQQLHDYGIYSILPEEMELEISESDIVKEKSNLEMWEEIFFDESRDPDEKAAVLNSLDYDPTQAYEKIVEGK